MLERFEKRSVFCFYQTTRKQRGECEVCLIKPIFNRIRIKEKVLNLSVCYFYLCLPIFASYGQIFLAVKIYVGRYIKVVK